MPEPVTVPVPMLDLSPQYVELKEEIDAAVGRVLESGHFILGPEVAAFEDEFAAYIGTARAVGVGNGTDALLLIIEALGLSPGDEVITTGFSFIATAEALARLGVVPVFADIEPRTFNLDPDSVAAKLTERTRAILAVNLFGQPAGLSELAEIAGERGVYLVEDCAQSHGATYRGLKAGSVGVASAFSFFPTKPLGCAGDGGIVCTDYDELADRIRALRAHGSRKKYVHEALGINSRLDEIQAAILRVKLGRLDAWNDSRRRIASAYDAGLTGVQVPFVAAERDHVYHQYTVRAAERDRLTRALAEKEVGFNIHYPTPMHLQPCFAYLGYHAGDLPECEKAAGDVLSLPIYHGMPDDHVSAVCEAVNASVAGAA